MRPETRPSTTHDPLDQAFPLFKLVARDGVEPSTFRFSVGRSYQLSYLAVRAETRPGMYSATQTGLEPATFAVTGRRANQLRHWASLYVPPTGFEPALPP